jgi:D,D-heptose 1,7-bisphosphate phosphatase
MNKAVFLDRDGTINFDYSHVFHPERVQILEGVAESIAELKEAGFLVVIVTNQSCLGRGLATPEQVNLTNEKICGLISAQNKNAKIDLILIAPDHPEHATNRRKPQPGMLFEAKETYNIDLAISWIVGDKESDPLTGTNAGIPQDHCLLVNCNQIEEPVNKSAFQQFLTLKEATNFILKHQN